MFLGLLGMWPLRALLLATAASTIVVSPTGTDTPACGSTQAPCSTLPYALTTRNATTVRLTAGRFPSSNCGASVGVSVVIQGAGMEDTVIDCAGADRALYATSSVSVSGLSITGGFVDAMSRGGAHGGAAEVYWEAGGSGLRAEFHDVAVYNNTIDCTFCPEYDDDAGEQCDCRGGGISVYLPDGNFNDCIVNVSASAFHGNTLKLTGPNHHPFKDAFYSMGAGLAVSALVPAHVTDWGVYISNTTFAHNDILAPVGTDSNAGGFTMNILANRAVRTTVTLSGVVFHDNTIGDGQGGGFELSLQSAYAAQTAVRFDGCGFYDNLIAPTGVSTQAQGGGAYFYLDPRPTAGSLFVDTSIIVSGCTFTGNTADMGSGGVGFMVNSGDDVPESHIDGLWLVTEDSFFAHNVVASEGGSGGGAGVGVTVIPQNVSNVAVVVDSCLFVENSCGRPGVAASLQVIPDEGLSNSSVVVDGCVFAGNNATSRSTAAGDGGAFSALFVWVLPYGGDVPLVADAPHGPSENLSALATGTVPGLGALVNMDFVGAVTTVKDATVMVDGCVIADNTARAGGSGLQLVVSPGKSVEVSGATLTLRNSVVANHVSENQPGGVLLEFPVIDTFVGSSITVEGCVILNNTGASGGGVFLQNANEYPGDLNIVFKRTVVANNSLNGDPSGSGAGVFFVMSLDSPESDSIVAKPRVFRKWYYYSNITFDTCAIVNNTACGACTGGGIGTSGGGSFTLLQTTVAGNSAGQGGGLYLAPGSNSLTAVGSVFEGNSADDGAQIMDTAGGYVSLHDTTVSLALLDGVQVAVLAGGNITASNSILPCPLGSVLVRAVDFGQYVLWDLTWTMQGPMLASALQLSCLSCPFGTYTLEPSFSRGTPDSAVTPTCLRCPYGAVCNQSDVHPVVNFWGAATVNDAGTPVVSLLECPTGYCCQSPSQCSSVAACRPHRTGRLCGTCAPGYSELVGSPSCVATADCNDGAWVWPLAVVATFVAGVLVLRVSELWAPSTSLPTGTFKVLAYYFQLVSVVLSTAPRTRVGDALQGVLSAVSLKVPTVLSAGVCAIPGLTPVLKACLDYIVPVAVTVAMVILFGVGAVIDRRQLCGESCRRMCWGKHAYRHAPSPRTAGPSVHEPLLERGSLQNPTPEDDSINDATKMRTRHRVYSAGWNLLMLVYFNFAAATFALLRCVRIPGEEGGYFLFIDANTECVFYGWQVPLVVVAAAVVCFPVYVWWRSVGARRRRHNTGHGFDLVLHRTMSGMYREECSFWEGVLIGHRLAVAVLYTFVVGAPVVRSVSIGTVTAGVAALHTLYKPFRNPATQALQVALLTFLTVICFVVVPAAALQDAAITYRQLQLPAVEVDNTFLSVVTAGFGYVLPAMAGVWGWWRGRDTQPLRLWGTL